jgi:hypothetical protein
MQPLQTSILVKMYRKIRYRKGFGVHSPFVYNLITKVVEEKHNYYALAEIEALRQQMRTDPEWNQTATREILSAAYGALLFRMVNFFKCRNVIAIECSTGITGLYLAMAARNRCNCWLLSEHNKVTPQIRQFAATHNLSKLQYLDGDCCERITRLRGQLQEVDLLLIRQLPETLTAEELLRTCRPLIKQHSILILDGISRKKEMRNTWQLLKQDAQTRLMLDLYTLGIVFFDNKLPKQYYKVYFDDKKKQDLHTNRRPRLYLIGRRKKSTENTLSH